MKHWQWGAVGSAGVLLVACASRPERDTLAELRDMEPDVAEVEVEDSLDRAMASYRDYLDETPESVMTPEALRRLADLQIEKQYGIIGDGEIVELAAPEPSADVDNVAAARPATEALTLPESARGTAPIAASETAGRNVEGLADLSESDQDFEVRTTGQDELPAVADTPALGIPDADDNVAVAGPLEAIAIYKRILTEYPNYERTDQVLYQLARAYDEIGQPEEAMGVMDDMSARYPYSRYLDEIHFRRGEFLFTRRQFRAAEEAYEKIIETGEGSSYYELALYKLGWSLYKQEFYEEALHRYLALLDYKLSIGYDFDDSHTEAEERRVADTFRVISLSFSNLGEPAYVDEYFTTFGRRSYEDRVYSNLGEFYLTKLRYNDAAKVYSAFVELNPFHRSAPRFSMRIADIYTEGNFPLLVVEAKKEFATRYGLESEYWQHFDVAEHPEVLDYLKTNLKDLAIHYHSLYQDEVLAEAKPTNFNEASLWYRAFLTSFPDDVETPSINYQLADLLLENEDYRAAATEYERTAYDYAPHEQAAAAGYAAVFAHRENLAAAQEFEYPAARRATVESSLRFAESFPDHENAAVVLGAAADDLYEMREFERAIMAGRTVVERYPSAEIDLRRSAWIVVAHSSFEISDFPNAEQAYSQVLDLLPTDDESRPGFVENLAATIYKQGEEANLIEDYRAAANHFLRVKAVTPTSDIRPAAEYDAAAALIRLEDWPAAASVLEAFRETFPEHEFQREVTKQLASVYRQGGQIDRSASEYERVAAESDDPQLRSEAMLLAAELYEEAGLLDNTLDVYLRYVAEFPQPLDLAQETRSKIADIYESRSDIVNYHEMLGEIVAADSAAGAERTDRSRFLAAGAALVLAEPSYDRFVEVELTQPFADSLAEKQRRMDAALQIFESLVSYKVGEVTAAATYYIAEVYFEFSRSLLESERPTDLSAGDLVDYELAIEEEAFPFEEQAIEVHESNFELVTAGIYNEWVQKSLERLGVLMPGRYAKYEISSGFLGSLESYSYQSPAAIEAAMQELSEPAAATDGVDGGPDDEDDLEPADDLTEEYSSASAQ
jgi:tetratricopeptide (TPR) repeat protein